MALVDFQELINDLARDPASAVSDSARDRALELSVIKYSSDRPKTIKVDIPGAASPLLPLPSEFDPGFSAVNAVETIAVDGRPTPLNAPDWSVYQGTTGWHLLLGELIDSTQGFRVAVTVEHSVSISQDTVPRVDREAVANWAASIVLQQLSTEYAGDNQSTIDADTVNHAAKSNDYAARAEEFRQLYYEHLDIVPTLPVTP